MIDYKGVIFDLDGTILDSLHIWDKINKEFFINLKMCMPEDYIKNISSMTPLETAIYTREICNIEDEPEELLQVWQEMALKEYRSNIKLKPGVSEYLEFLKENNIKMAVVTMCNPNLYKPCLKKHGIDDFFDIIVDADVFAGNKNSPDIFLECADKMNLQASEIIVFEDIIQAIKSAKQAGMKVYAVYEKHSREDFKEIIKESDEYISDFREMFNT